MMVTSQAATTKDCACNRTEPIQRRILQIITSSPADHEEVHDDAEDGEQEAEAADEQVEAADQVAARAAERRAGRDDQALRAAERRHHVIYGDASGIQYTLR